MTADRAAPLKEKYGLSCHIPFLGGSLPDGDAGAANEQLCQTMRERLVARRTA